MYQSCLNTFSAQLSTRNGLKPKTFTKQALEILSSLPWRGNVREISNVVERLMILSESDAVTASDVQRLVLPGSSQGQEFSEMLISCEHLSEFRDQAERSFLQHKLDINNWNISRTAKQIGVQRSSLHTKIKRYNLERDA